MLHISSRPLSASCSSPFRSPRRRGGGDTSGDRGDVGVQASRDTFPQRRRPFVAVAHTYDELTSGAAACLALTPAAAFEILGATHAAEFDPAVVAALRTLLTCRVPVEASAPTREVLNG